MKTAYIATLLAYPEKAREQFLNTEKKIEPLFVIGVKNAESDLDSLLRAIPQIQVVNRMKEVYNINYHDSASNHILQPCVITWKD